ncbi:neuferricin [Battus philenor]|uniref:neuferricin n=1 Tax=Battus philenor TaxID=42288 RepID=UPI0035D0AE27
MALRKYLRHNVKVIIFVFVIIVAVSYRKCRDTNFFSTENKTNDQLVFSKEQLSQYNGIVNDRLYLAVLGHVFDVTDGAKHYAPGSSYNYFIGKDGSRALVTGDFKDESQLKDHVLDLPCNDLSTLLHWRQTYRRKYKFMGILNGRFYDEHGKETNYFMELKSRLKQCKAEKTNMDKENLKYPPCNISWNAEEGSRVWCTKSSGGVERDWVGVPRQIFTPGEEKPRCVCINLDKQDTSTNIKKYDNCPDASTTCMVLNT